MATQTLLYGVEDRPPSLITTTLLSLQHLLAALGGIIAVPLVFGGALKLPADQIVALVNAALLGSGIVTIIQCKGVGPMGIRLPCVMGTSFAFVGAGISVGLEHGVPGILGSSLVGSLVMIVGSFFMPVMRKLFPHTVTSVVVTMIGLSLTPVAVDWAAGGRGSPTYGAGGHLAIALFVLALVIIFVQWGRGIVSASAVVLGILCGYLLCLVLGLIDFTQVRNAEVFALPQPFRFGMTFPVSGIVAMSIAFLVTIVETTGTFMALGAFCATASARRSPPSCPARRCPPSRRTWAWCRSPAWPAAMWWR
jgi:xanthine/uracil permease